MPNPTTLLRVDLAKLHNVFDRMCLAGTTYLLGGKAPSLNAEPEDIDRIDCSGFVRYAIYQAGNGFKIPDGSFKQREWCEEQGLHEVADYADINAHMTKNRLFIAFITAGVRGAGRVGHVWLIGDFDPDRGADTMESYGGHGVGSRQWNHPVLVRRVHKVFEIPTI
jgi:hypothetical protein